MFAKVFDSFLPSTTRAESPKLSRERKTRDLRSSSSISSPRTSLRGSPRRSPRTATKRTIAEEVPFAERYNITKPDFAKGAYGKVCLAEDKLTLEKVVIKKIAKRVSIKMIQNEVNAGRLLGYHPNIATFLDYQEFADHHALALQFVEGCDLFTYLEDRSFTPQSEISARSIFTSIMSAIKHSHSKSIAHRDIKLENILINRYGQVSLIDFGLCSFFEDGKKCREAVGSEHYVPPEVMRRAPYFGDKADIFSAGIVLYALLFGVFPFDCLRLVPTPLLPKLVLRFPVDVNVSTAAKDLLFQMLRDDPDRRIDVDGIFNHEWMNEKSSPILLKQSCDL